MIRLFFHQSRHWVFVIAFVATTIPVLTIDRAANASGVEIPAPEKEDKPKPPKPDKPKPPKPENPLVPDFIEIEKNKEKEFCTANPDVC